jgi:hypothetical protein
MPHIFEGKAQQEERWGCLLAGKLQVEHKRMYWAMSRYEADAFNFDPRPKILGSSLNGGLNLAPSVIGIDERNQDEQNGACCLDFVGPLYMFGWFMLAAGVVFAIFSFYVFMRIGDDFLRPWAYLRLLGCILFFWMSILSVHLSLSILGPL